MTSEPLASCCTRSSRTTSRPFLVHVILGAGSPRTEQSKMTRSWSDTAWLPGGISTRGGTVVQEMGNRNRYIYIHIFIYIMICVCVCVCVCVHMERHGVVTRWDQHARGDCERDKI